MSNDTTSPPAFPEPAMKKWGRGWWSCEQVRAYGDAREAALRGAIRAMAGALNGREWAEHISSDPDVTALETEITALIPSGVSGYDGVTTHPEFDAKGILEQAANGPNEASCGMCSGRGFYGSPGGRCTFCDGTGRVRWRSRRVEDQPLNTTPVVDQKPVDLTNNECALCKGTGVADLPDPWGGVRGTCPDCYGDDGCTAPDCDCEPGIECAGRAAPTPQRGDWRTWDVSKATDGTEMVSDGAKKVDHP